MKCYMFVILILIYAQASSAGNKKKAASDHGSHQPKIKLQFEMRAPRVARAAFIPKPEYSYKRRGSATRTNSCNHVRAVPRSLYFITKWWGYYQKYTEAYGIPIVSSRNVQDRALKRACNIVRFLFADRADVRQSIYQYHGRFGVIAESEGTTSIPEFSHLPASWNTRARGLGGELHKPMSCGGEENLLCKASDRYRGDDIFFHESAHGVGEVALKYGFNGWYNRLIRAFNAARRAGKWSGTYSLTDTREYFSEGMQSFFANHKGPNHVHNNIDTRAELRTYDNGLYKLIKEVYPCMNRYTMCSNDFLKTMKMDCKAGTTPVTKKKGCVDLHNSCTSWANGGYCKSRPTWMKNNCCKACKSIKVTTKKCVDLKNSCKRWSNEGYCTKSAVYMKKNCCKACKSKGGKSSCSNKSKSTTCNSWAAYGYCTKTYVSYMKENCKKSCRFC